MGAGAGIGGYAGTALIYVFAAIAEIAGCFAFWALRSLNPSVSGPR